GPLRCPEVRDPRVEVDDLAGDFGRVGLLVLQLPARLDRIERVLPAGAREPVRHGRRDLVTGARLLRAADVAADAQDVGTCLEERCADVVDLHRQRPGLDDQGLVDDGVVRGTLAARAAGSGLLIERWRTAGGGGCPRRVGDAVPGVRERRAGAAARGEDQRDEDDCRRRPKALTEASGTTNGLERRHCQSPHGTGTDRRSWAWDARCPPAVPTISHFGPPAMAFPGGATVAGPSVR